MDLRLVKGVGISIAIGIEIGIAIAMGERRSGDFARGGEVFGEGFLAFGLAEGEGPEADGDGDDAGEEELAGVAEQGVSEAGGDGAGDAGEAAQAVIHAEDKALFIALGEFGEER